MNPLDLLRGLRLLARADARRALAAAAQRHAEVEALRRRFPHAILDERIVVAGSSDGIEFEAGEGPVRIAAGTVLAVDRGESDAVLRIGWGTYVGEYCNLRTAPNAALTIGRRCLIAQFVTLITADHETRDDSPVIVGALDTSKLGIAIGDDVWIGAGAVVLPGVRVGAGAVIGAGSVVTGDVAPHAVCAGVPARMLRMRTPPVQATRSSTQHDF